MALQTFEDGSHPHPISITKLPHFLPQTEKIALCLTNKLLCVFLNFIKTYLVEILITQKVKFFVTLAGNANSVLDKIICCTILSHHISFANVCLHLLNRCVDL